MKQRNKLANRTNLLIILAIIILIGIIAYPNIITGNLFKPAKLTNMQPTLTQSEIDEIDSAIKAQKAYLFDIQPRYNIFENKKGDYKKTELALDALNSKNKDTVRNINIVAFVNKDNPKIVETLCNKIDFKACTDSGRSEDKCGQEVISELQYECKLIQGGRFYY